MATRSMILYVNEDKTVDASYIHHDGYPDGPHGVGFQLKTNFTTPLVARSVAGRGDRSSLEDASIYEDGYIRRGADYKATLEAAREMCCEYCYIYNNNKWRMRRCY